MTSQVWDISVGEAIEKLRVELLRAEGICLMTSEQMLEALQRNECVETAEISLWMAQYHDYQQLLRVTG